MTDQNNIRPRCCTVCGHEVPPGSPYGDPLLSGIALPKEGARIPLDELVAAVNGQFGRDFTVMKAGRWLRAMGLTVKPANYRKFGEIVNRTCLLGWELRNQ